jgi:coenzyme F420-reducing hydrogenase beta subunit
MTQDNGMTTDWWEDLLEERRKDGAIDAEAGTVYFPHSQESEDPQDMDENEAYSEGWRKRREELGDKFEWE